VEIAEAARAAFLDIPLMLDANSAYTLADAPTFKKMEPLNLLMIEQPLGSDDLYEHSLLKQQMKVPVCLDESIHSFGDTQLALHIQAMDILNLKPPRVGGWTNARRIHDLCRENGIPVWIGGMIETELGTSGKVALAALPGVTLPSDIAESGERYAIQVAEPLKLNPEDSTITVPTRPGLGVEIDMEAIQKITLRKETFK
jgi:o-succinylbenzoate synthase